MWEITVLDGEGFARTFTYDVKSRTEAILVFLSRSKWNRRKLGKRLLRMEKV